MAVSLWEMISFITQSAEVELARAEEVAAANRRDAQKRRELSEGLHRNIEAQVDTLESLEDAVRRREKSVAALSTARAESVAVDSLGATVVAESRKELREATSFLRDEASAATDATNEVIIYHQKLMSDVQREIGVDFTLSSVSRGPSQAAISPMFQYNNEVEHREVALQQYPVAGAKNTATARRCACRKRRLKSSLL